MAEVLDGPRVFLPPPGSPRPGNSRPARSAPNWPMVAVGLVLLALGLVIVFRDQLTRIPSLPRRSVNDSGEVVDAFAGPTLEPDAAEVRAISQVLERLLKASRYHDAGAMSELWDVERMYQEAKRAGGFASITAAQEPAVLEAIRAEYPAKMLEAFAYDRFELRSCKLAEGRGEAAVYVRLWSEESRGDKVRLWLVGGKDQWRLYDYEDLVNCLRMSDTTAEATLQIRSRRDARMQQAWAEDIERAWELIRQGDTAKLAKAQRILDGIDTAELPNSLQTFCWLMRASLELGLGRPQEALAACDQAEQRRRNLPVLPYLRACAENQRNHHQQAETLARQYIERIGSDADVEAQLGYALWGQRRFPEAAEAFRRGLRDDPNSFDNLFHLGLVLPPDELGELRRHADRMESFADNFPLFCESYLEQDAAGAFTTLLAYQTSKRPEAAETEYYQAYLRQDWKQVIEIYEQRIPKDEGPSQLTYRPTLVAALFHQDRALEAYKRILPAEEVFNQLAMLCTHAANPTLLRKLIDAHRSRRPDDIQLQYWEADWNYLREDYEETIERLVAHQPRIVQETELGPMLIDRLIRSLIYERRFDEAAAQAQQWHSGTGDPWYAALTAVTRGDADSALAWLKECTSQGYSPLHFHVDSLMGPALQSERMKQVLAQYPVPWQEAEAPAL